MTEMTERDAVLARMRASMTDAEWVDLMARQELYELERDSLVCRHGKMRSECNLHA